MTPDEVLVDRDDRSRESGRTRRLHFDLMLMSASGEAWRREGRDPGRRPWNAHFRRTALAEAHVEIGERPILWHIMKIYGHQASTTSWSALAIRAT